MRLLYIFLFAPLLSFCSEKKREMAIKDSIGFEIIEKEVRINLNKPTFELSVILSNSSDKNFILYSFKRTTIIASGYDSIFFNKLPSSLGAGNAIMVLDKKGNRQQIEIDDCDDCEEPDPISHRSDFLTILKDSVSKNYLETTEVLKAKSKKKVKVKVEFNHINLRKGEYQFYMIYYCGHDIVKIIGEQTIKADEKKHGAMAFNGWIKSNTIKLIVE